MPRGRNRQSSNVEVEETNQTGSSSNKVQYVFDEDQLQRLLNGLKELSIADTDTSLQSVAHSQTNPVGNFSRCTARFKGETEEDVEAFLDSVITYKECVYITDENALRGLSMLLEKTALQWWVGVKRSIHTWEEALSALRNAYSKKLPPYAIYKRIFACEQGEEEATELFVCKVRAMFSQLPYLLEENVTIDMIYGLLNRRIKKRLVREDINSFEELLTTARGIEHSLADIPKKEVKETRSKSPNPKPSYVKKCYYCRQVGHTKAECPKITSRRDATAKFSTSSSISCYGCGAPGVIKSQCQKCSPKNSSDAGTALMGVSDGTARSKPLIEYTVNGFKCASLADTGAQITIAGYRMYQLLQGFNCKFSEEKMMLSYADGRTMQKDVLKTSVDIVVGGRTVRTEMVVDPSETKTRTLLGIDFLCASGIILCPKERSWYFGDEPKRRFQFYVDPEAEEPVRISSVNVEIQLRSDEGTDLSMEDRRKADLLLSEKENTFEQGGYTTLATHYLKTNSDTPISAPPYQVQGEKREAMLEEIKRLLKEDIIEESDSPWASPVIMLRKKEIIDGLEGEDETKLQRWTDRRFVMNQGVLYRNHIEDEDEEPKLAVPIEMRKGILKQYHDAPTAAHRGVFGTYKKISKRFYWKGNSTPRKPWRRRGRPPKEPVEISSGVPQEEI